MPFDVDKANPADDSIVSQFPANERNSRTNIEDWTDFEHDKATGRHKIPAGSIAARDGITEWKQGALWINTDATPDELQIQVNAIAPFSWVTIGPKADTFAAGTRMVFQQTAAPTGWTKDTTANLNDTGLRIVTGTVGSVTAQQGFSTVFSKTATDGHTLTIAQMPAHVHSINTILIAGGGGVNTDVGRGTDQASADENTNSTGGGGSHSHNMDIRVNYHDVIIASKD